MRSVSENGERQNMTCKTSASTGDVSPKRTSPVRVERTYIKDRPNVDPNYAV
jgi:hypothetical protein